MVRLTAPGSHQLHEFCIGGPVNQIKARMYLFIKSLVLDDRPVFIGKKPHACGLYGKVFFIRQIRVIGKRHWTDAFLPCFFPHFLRNHPHLFHRTVQHIYLCNVLLRTQKGYRSGRSACAQENNILPLHADIFAAHGPVEAGHVRIIALKSAFCPNQSVDCADFLCQRVDFHNPFHHLFFVRYGDIHSQHI